VKKESAKYLQIMVGDNYIITADDYNFILQERKISDPNHHLSKSKVATEKLVTVGYYSRMEHVTNALIQRDIKAMGNVTLQEVLSLLKSKENELTIAITEAVTSKEVSA
jgi:hypothetical protein